MCIPIFLKWFRIKIDTNNVTTNVKFVTIVKKNDLLMKDSKKYSVI
jgi:hypothetical protein